MDTYAGYGYDNSSFDLSGMDVFGGFFGIILGVFGFIMLISLIISIIGIIGQWKLLKKAGQPGWPAIVPFYNQYMLCKIAGVNPWWILIVFLSSALAAIPYIGQIIVIVVSIYFSILLNTSLANSYGKDTGWVIGLIFLNPFFMFALGNGKSQYLGPKPMKDIIFKNDDNVNNNPNNMNNAQVPVMGQTNSSVDQNQFINNNLNNVNSSNVETLQTPSATKFCSSCGIQVSQESMFCPSCGKQL